MEDPLERRHTTQTLSFRVSCSHACKLTSASLNYNGQNGYNGNGGATLPVSVPLYYGCLLRLGGHPGPNARSGGTGALRPWTR